MKSVGELMISSLRAEVSSFVLSRWSPAVPFLSRLAASAEEGLGVGGGLPELTESG